MALIVKPTGLEKIWASGGVKETPADSKITQGHVVELPAYQYVNWLVNKQDTFIAHVNQVGIPVWDAVTEYIGGKSYVQGTDGVVYKALLTNTNIVPSNPLNSTTWVKAFEDFGSVAALTVTVNNLTTNYSTLAGIANTAAARANLSVYSKVESDARFAPVLGNPVNTFLVANATSDEHAINRGQFLSLLNQATESSPGTAEIADQTEMNVGTDDSKIVTPKKGKATYLMRANNLSDLTNVAAARNNLGLTSTATTPLADLLTKSGNLVGLTNVTTARTNLGLGNMAVENSTDWLSKAGNLTGLGSVSATRANLGLGNSATRNVGTSTGTVAEGDDSRIVNAVPNSRQIIAGNGITGGGALTNNVTLNLGTPGTLSAFTGNGASATSHTHAVDINSWFGDRAGGTYGYYVLPGGFCFQWGIHNMGGGPSEQYVGFHRAFAQVWNIQLTNHENAPGEAAGAGRVMSYDGNGFMLRNSHTNTYTAYMWFAIGLV